MHVDIAKELRILSKSRYVVGVRLEAVDRSIRIQ